MKANSNETKAGVAITIPNSKGELELLENCSNLPLNYRKNIQKSDLIAVGLSDPKATLSLSISPQGIKQWF
jgi:hypothetical protein